VAPHEPPDRVLAEEPPSLWIVVSGAVKIETRLRVELTGGVLERVHERPGRRGLFAERVGRIRLCQHSGCVAQGSDGAESVRLVVTRCGRTQHRQKFIDVPGLRIAGYNCTAGIDLLDETVAIVGVDAGARTGRFLDAPSEGIVLEVHRSPGTTADVSRFSASQPYAVPPLLVSVLPLLS
jgi:hypothetical protein